MKDILTIIKFTFSETVKKKTFYIPLVVMLLLIVIGFNAPNIMTLIKKEATLEEVDYSENILLIDKEKIFKDYKDEIKFHGIKVANKEYNKKEIKKTLINKDYDAVITVSEKDNNLELKYYTEKIGFESILVIDLNIFDDLYQSVKLERLGLTNADILMVKAPIITETIEFKSSESETIMIISVIMSVLLFYFIYSSSFQVSASVTQEKTSRLIDTLITATAPKNIIIGKTLGIGLVGVLQLVLMLFTSVLSYKLFLPQDNFVYLILSNVVFNPKLIIMFIIYFILGYILYSFLFALTGSFVSKTEDLQQANGIVSLLLFFGYYISVVVPIMENDSLNKLVSLIPFTSPFITPGRFIANNLSSFDLLASIVLLILAIILLAYISIRVYSNAILNYGTKLSIKEVFKMYKRN